MPKALPKNNSRAILRDGSSSKTNGVFFTFTDDLFNVAGRRVKARAECGPS